MSLKCFFRTFPLVRHLDFPEVLFRSVSCPDPEPVSVAAICTSVGDELFRLPPPPVKNSANPLQPKSISGNVAHSQQTRLRGIKLWITKSPKRRSDLFLEVLLMLAQEKQMGTPPAADEAVAATEVEAAKTAKAKPAKPFKR